MLKNTSPQSAQQYQKIFLIILDGFGDGNDPLLLPVLRVLIQKPEATYEDVFECLSKK
jgi:hypothetical protein